MLPFRLFVGLFTDIYFSMFNAIINPLPDECSFLSGRGRMVFFLSP